MNKSGKTKTGCYRMVVFKRWPLGGVLLQLVLVLINKMYNIGSCCIPEFAINLATCK